MKRTCYLKWGPITDWKLSPNSFSSFLPVYLSVPLHSLYNCYFISLILGPHLGGGLSSSHCSPMTPFFISFFSVCFFFLLCCLTSLLNSSLCDFLSNMLLLIVAVLELWEMIWICYYCAFSQLPWCMQHWRTAFRTYKSATLFGGGCVRALFVFVVSMCFAHFFSEVVGCRILFNFWDAQSIYSFQEWWKKWWLTKWYNLSIQWKI